MFICLYIYINQERVFPPGNVKTLSMAHGSGVTAVQETASEIIR